MKKLAILAALCAAFPAYADRDGDKIRARLTGFEEVPSVSTVARGEFDAEISRDEQFIDYKLTYSGLQGTVTQAHIHFGQRHTPGAIVIWLCGSATNPGPAGTQACPPSTPAGVTVTGTIRAADVVVPPATTGAQQIAAGELAEVISAIHAGAAYANVHSTLSPAGEIRGQIRGSRGGDNDHGHGGGHHH
jgi:hypothetical protein